MISGFCGNSLVDTIPELSVLLSVNLEFNYPYNGADAGQWNCPGSFSLSVLCLDATLFHFEQHLCTLWFSAIVLLSYVLSLFCLPEEEYKPYKRLLCWKEANQSYFTNVQKNPQIVLVTLLAILCLILFQSWHFFMHRGNLSAGLCR